MKFGFNGIFDEKLYESSKVVFITGPYAVFANYVADKLRAGAVGTIEITEEDNEVLDEFGIEHGSELTGNTAVPFDVFMDICRTPCLTGKWYCRVDWKELTKKQQGVVDRYIKNPGEYGMLVVTFSEFGDYSRYLKSRVLMGSDVSHIVQVSFPSRKGLRQYITERFKSRNVGITTDAVDTFILRLSNDYDSYNDLIDSIAVDNAGRNVDRKMILEALKGIENYVLDDFVAQLTVPAHSTKAAINRKNVKMLRAMLDEFGPVELVGKLKYRIANIIQMRMAINRGIVPVRIRYSVAEAKAKLDDDSRIKGVNDYSFKRMAEVASLTSLRDWVWMLMILSSPKTRFDEVEHMRALFNLINRTSYSENRLLNSVGVLDNLGIQPEVYMEIQREMLAEQCETESIEAYKKALKEPATYSVISKPRVRVL